VSPAIEFTVYGHPATKGSVRRAKLPNGDSVLVNSNPRGVRWQAAIAVQAYRARFRAGVSFPFAGAIAVVAHFHLRRPKDAADYPRRCDIDKLLRCALDGMTGVLFVDDRQVTVTHAFKSFALDEEGATFSVTEVAHGWQETTEAAGVPAADV
jgi:Holliday junction resolvase RusA-like endonuclease